MNLDSGTKEQVQPRLIMCPQCHQRFETMRRFQMVCTECGYEWEEESQLSTGDRFSRFTSDAGEYVFMWAAWAVMGAVALFVASFFVIGFISVVERRGIGTAMPLLLLAVVVALVVAAVMRPMFEWQERMMFWRMGWRGGKNDPPDYKGR